MTEQLPCGAVSETDEMVRLYQEGLSTHAVAREVGTYQARVMQVLIDAGVARHATGKPRRTAGGRAPMALRLKLNCFNVSMA